MNFTEYNNTLRCVFSGKLDTLTCSGIEDVLDKRITGFLEKQDVACLIFDLSEVDYVSSAFLRLCLCYFKSAGKKNFRIENLKPDVRNVFQLSGFMEIMNIVP
ncbi:MAG: STAS domain-containing protein [Planctomycetaceae bacterium]|jgi:anti-anti-sigma factor|nr:STAS domain-containing protein [Planctomycetaceae bacterium]